MTVAPIEKLARVFEADAWTHVSGACVRGRHPHADVHQPSDADRDIHTPPKTCARVSVCPRAECSDTRNRRKKSVVAVDVVNCRPTSKVRTSSFVLPVAVPRRLWPAGPAYLARVWVDVLAWLSWLHRLGTCFRGL
jgi:hypothetical protein